MKRLGTFFLISLSFLFSPMSWAAQGGFDHSAWDQFLKKYVQEDGSFDYSGAKKDPSLLEQYERQLKKFRKVEQSPREEIMAVFINAYHFGLVRAILKAYPVKNVEHIPGLWDIQNIRIGKTRLSLNQIKKDQLLGTYRDEKIHTALVCGGKSCPKWIPEAYTGARMEGLLYQAAVRFVNDSNLNKIEVGAKKIHLSRMFKWSALDFKLDFGAFENDRGWSDETFAVVSFAANYLEDFEKVQYLEKSSFKVDYLPFDWTLNDKPATTPAQSQ